MHGIRTFIFRVTAWRLALLRLVALALSLPVITLLAPLHAQAQAAKGTAAPRSSAAPWVWLDANGRQVFSDRAPPPDVPDRRILRQPTGAWPEALPRVEPLPNLPATAVPTTVGAGGPLPAAAASAASAPRRPASAPGAAAAQAAAKTRAEAAEKERIAALRADNCNRARSALATLDSGVRLTTTNAKGEREILDEAARSAEAARLRSIMASDCAAP